MADDSSIEHFLRAAQLRRTPVRAGVLEVLLKSARPMGAVDILAQLPPHTDAVTVYRTLNTLTSKKLLHRVRGEDRVWRYALTQPDQPTPHQHPHFVCEDCGKVECLHEAHVPKNFLPSLHVPGNYSVNYSEIVLHGICPKCQP